MVEMDTIEQIYNDASQVINEVIEKAKLKDGQLFIIGCSSSETIGEHMGTASSKDASQAIYSAVVSELQSRNIRVAVQCCEHLNRALIVEHEAVPNAEIVNVLPQPKAGSSFATAAYESFHHPVALEEIRADAGLDIGGTLIGMHLKKVAVPVRLKQDHIGQAIVLAARVRPKFIGGERAIYNEELKNGYPDFDAE